MTNDSSTGGYLQPEAGGPAVLQDAALDAFLQSIVAQLSGISGQLVFPRWQITPPNLPSNGTNWASIGVTGIPDDTYAYEAHNPIFPPNPIPAGPDPAPSNPNGYDVQIKHEVLKVLCCFYGPSAQGNACLVRDGLQVAQNREALQLAGMAWVNNEPAVKVPELVNNQWYNRVDLPVNFRREVVRYYPILNLVSAAFTTKSDTGFTETVTVSNS